MKKLALLLTMAIITFSCGEEKAKTTEGDFQWQVDKFDDIAVLQYKVHGFDELTLQQKKLVYYLSQSALAGRDIIFDQNFKYNLSIRRTLESIYQTYTGDKTTEDWAAFETYLKKVWFANGIHHHYSNDKFQPAFSETYFDELIANSQLDPSIDVEELKPVMFNPELYASKVNQAAKDLVTESATNFYSGVTQAEVEAYYAAMIDPNDRQPISYGLNSQVVKENGVVTERVWKRGGMYSGAIEKIVYWLEKAAEVAENEHQKNTILKLVEYYNTGDLKTYDDYSVMWTQDTVSQVDFINGFVEVYDDPLGLKGTWEAHINFKDIEATKRTDIISANAQWFEDNSPVDPRFKKPSVKGVSAKVINAAMLGGGAYPSTSLGINLPNADWIRRDHGSKSVTISNISEAYNANSAGSGFVEEFIYDPEVRELRTKYLALADNLHTDLHECLGHGSGQLLPGVVGDELKNYGSALEETRADLFALYYLADDKLFELGIVPSKDLYKAEYYHYIMNGMMTQFARINLGDDVQQAHMRNRKLISEWARELGQADNVIELEVVDGKRYVRINDYEKLRGIFAKQLAEIQRIKSEGDYEAGKALIEKYAVKIDQDLHQEVITRYQSLGIAPYSGFVNPEMVPVLDKDGEIIDIKVTYPGNYVEQMLKYSKEWSFLPNKN